MLPLMRRLPRGETLILYGALGDAPEKLGVFMFTYLQLFKLTPVAREHLEKTPEYFEKITRSSRPRVARSSASSL